MAEEKMKATADEIRKKIKSMSEAEFKAELKECENSDIVKMLLYAWREEPPAPEPLPKWVRIGGIVRKVFSKSDVLYTFSGGEVARISDCTPVHVIDAEKWEGIKEVWDILAVQHIANGEQGGAWLADENVTRVCRAIKQLMEEEV